MKIPMKVKQILTHPLIPITVAMSLSVLSCRVGGYPDVIQAIRSDAHLKIESMAIYLAVGPSTRVSLTNSGTLDYMTRMFRGSTASFDSGFAKRAHIVLSNGKIYDVTFVIAPSRQSVAIGIGRGPFRDEMFYGVELVPPVPGELKEALAKMTAGDETNKP